MRTRWIVSMGLAAALCGAPALAQSPAPVITLGFKADVQVDGVPTNIQPDAALSPPLQAMVRKRVAEWRYRMGTWQGKPVAVTVSQQIMAEAVPVNGGGFAVRIKSVAYPSLRADSADAAEKKPRMVAPVYPAAQRCRSPAAASPCGSSRSPIRACERTALMPRRRRPAWWRRRIPRRSHSGACRAC